MRAVGYFRELSKSGSARTTRPETIGRQNRRFLDYCEEQGYEVAQTFSEESGSHGGPAFSQMIEYLKRPEKGFMMVVAPAPIDVVGRRGRCGGALPAGRTARRAAAVHGPRYP